MYIATAEWVSLNKSEGCQEREQKGKLSPMNHILVYMAPDYPLVLDYMVS